LAASSVYLVTLSCAAKHYTADNLPFGKLFVHFLGVALSSVEVALKLRASGSIRPLFTVVSRAYSFALLTDKKDCL
jgi:hypothetical protein